jgi:hypothetical protein
MDSRFSLGFLLFVVACGGTHATDLHVAPIANGDEKIAEKAAVMPPPPAPTGSAIAPVSEVEIVDPDITSHTETQ